MYEQLKPPTDNLYKFVAIFGLILLLMAGWLFKSHIDNVAKFGAEAIDMHLAAQREVADKRASKQSINSDNRYDHVREAELRIKSRVDAIGVQTNVFSVVVCLLTILGILLSGVGFALWYRRVQVIEDKIKIAQLDAMSERRCSECNKLIALSDE